MKVEKLTIKKELMEIPDGKQVVYFHMWEPISARILNSGEVAPESAMSAGQQTFEVQRVSNGTDEPKNYLVAVDDRRLYQELIMISDGTFQAAVDRKTDFYKDWMAREIQEQRWKIRSLSWWKRLFKKF
jgi:hypothetical protein